MDFKTISLDETFKEFPFLLNEEERKIALQWEVRIRKLIDCREPQSARQRTFMRAVLDGGRPTSDFQRIWRSIIDAQRVIKKLSTANRAIEICNAESLDLKEKILTLQNSFAENCRVFEVLRENLENEKAKNKNIYEELEKSWKALISCDIKYFPGENCKKNWEKFLVSCLRGDGCSGLEARFVVRYDVSIIPLEYLKKILKENSHLDSDEITLVEAEVLKLKFLDGPVDVWGITRLTRD